MELKIDQTLNFKNLVIQAKAFKNQYEGVLASFSYFELPKRVQFIRTFRDSIYSLNFEEWKKDRVWDYMNNYMSYEELISIARK